MTRDQLLTGILHFLSGHDLLSLNHVRAVLEREIDQAGPTALVGLRDQLASDRGWSYYPPDPLATRLHYLLADHYIQPDSEVLGIEHLEAIGAAPVTIFSNHLSYADANVIQVLLHRAGCATLASRLTALAGPKIFTSPHRRFSSLCFGTIKVPQSSDVSSEEAVLNPREVARAARQAIEVAAERLAAGDALLLFGEGTRSRTAQMQPMLAAVARYLDTSDTWVLPVGITGTEAFFPVGDVTVRPTRVRLCVGAPVRVDRLMVTSSGHRQTMMDVIGLMIAELLPPEYRGVYANGEACAEAVTALRQVRATGLV